MLSVSIILISLNVTLNENIWCVTFFEGSTSRSKNQLIKENILILEIKF